ncbi:hypothetical protein PAXRUDRAFT_154785 [Paxillus rubicundulus Ve08.2h10]|uniref:Uncharacterized protein n=1 Tax=Paxillus rubicundulus Ve08.2h10 TaxID=930991 RepID=A0A0D0D1Q9_9AGAM|nr:hypothetical protein PAXRUDRAFT_154785 [Paxillus rubicundulus Ve08.2h10]
MSHPFLGPSHTYRPPFLCPSYTYGTVIPRPSNTYGSPIPRPIQHLWVTHSSAHPIQTGHPFLGPSITANALTKISTRPTHIIRDFLTPRPIRTLRLQAIGRPTIGWPVWYGLLSTSAGHILWYPSTTLCDHFMDTYHKGLDGKQAAWAAKKYCGRHVLPASLMDGLDHTKLL